MTSKPNYEDVLTEPKWLLKGIDNELRSFVFTETNETRVRQLPFLDGRDEIATTRNQVSIPVRQAFEINKTLSMPRTGAIILHTSFCGSTLLANLVQASTNVLVYREPQILVDLATLTAKNNGLDLPYGNSDKLYQFVARQFSKSWSSVPTVIKPSNWANTLLPHHIAANPDCKYVIMTMPEEDFLLANLRGGKPRLNYSLNLLNHYLQAGMACRSDVLEIERGGYSPVGRLLRLLTVLHRAQDNLLERNIPNAARFHLSQIQRSPDKVLEETGYALGLKIDPALAARAIQSVMRRNSKAIQETYDLNSEKVENVRLRREFDAEFRQLEDWRDDSASETA